MGGFSRKMQLKSLASFWAALGFQRGVKWCKSEGVKDKLTPHSHIFFGLPRGIKRCKSLGLNCLLPPLSYTILTPLADQKSCKIGGLICLLPPHSYTILLHLEAQCSPKRCKSFELHFPKKSSHCSPTLTSLTPPPPPPPPAAQLLHHFTPWQPNSYINLPPQSYIF